MTAAGFVTGVSAVTAIGGALAAVGLRSIFHNILGFAAAMLGVAGLFLSLGSDFLAAVFVLVYVGAVAIAMVYAVMLSHPLDQAARPRSTGKVLGAAALAAVTGFALWRVLNSAVWPPPTASGSASAADVGRRFLTDYVLSFELISVLLVIAMMGAVMVARHSRTGRGRW